MDAKGCRQRGQRKSLSLVWAWAHPLMHCSKNVLQSTLQVQTCSATAKVQEFNLEKRIQSPIAYFVAKMVEAGVDKGLVLGRNGVKTDGAKSA